MTIELTVRQALTIARLVEQRGDQVSLHQLPDCDDVYLVAVGDPGRYLIRADGEAVETVDE